MAAYPSFPQLLASVREPVDDLDIDYSIAGNAKVRSYFTAVKNRFKVVHMLNATDLATLVTFYTTNRLLTFTFTWTKTSTVYTCLFAGPLREAETMMPTLTRVEVSIVQQ